MSLKITKVQCTDGQFISIEFMAEAAYKQNKKIASLLVDVCSLTIENRGYTGARRIVLASKAFLKYLSAVNKERINTQAYTCYSDLDAQVFRAWYMFMTRTESSNLAWRYFCALRSGLKKFHETTDIYTLPPMPSIRKPETNPTEPLDNDGVDQLIKALRKEVDLLYAKVEFREKVDSTGQVIQHSSQDFDDKNKYSLENIAAAFHSHKNRQYGVIRKWIGIYNDNHSKYVDPENFIEELKHGEWQARALKGRSPGKITMSNMEIPIEDAITTMIQHNYPMEMEFDDLIKNHAINRHHELHTKMNKTTFDLLKLKTQKSSYYSMQEILDSYFTTAKDQTILLIFIMLQTGWNKEVVLSIDRDTFEHSLGKSIDSNTTLIESFKGKGQSDSSAPYNNEKFFYAASHKDNKYSSYNLIKLAIRLSTPFYNKFSDADHQKNIDRNHIFLFLNTANRWATDGRTNSLLSNKAQIRGIKEFLAEHKISSHEHRIKTRDDILKRLRPTWLILKKQEQTVPQDHLQLLMGHSSKDTTDIFYDSTSTATYPRKIKLSDELAKVTEMLKTSGFKGKLSNNLLRLKAKNNKSKSGLLFSDPVRNKPIIFCKNSFRPDWNGFEKFIIPDSQCFYIHKCLFCSQCVVTKDTLPYLIDREIYIDQQERSLSSFEYSTLFGDEHNIITYILGSWPDQDDIEEAEEFQEANAPLLPSDLKLLIPLIIEVN